MNTFAYLNDLPADGELIHRRSDTALKALNEDGSRVGGYLVVWGNSAQKDLQNEYFTPETELGLDWYDQRPMLYHHGLDGDLKAEVIGVIDTLKADATGVWAEAQLNMRKRYIQVVKDLINRGVLGWSSGSLPHLVEVEDDGRIKRWPIVEGSATPAPAEPRKTTIGAIKSALAAYATDDKEPLAEDQQALKAEIELELEEQNPQEVNNMNPRDMLLQLLAQLLAAKPDVQLTPEEQNALVDQVLQSMQAADATMSAPIPAENLQPVTMKAATAIMNAFSAIQTQKAAALAAQQNTITDAMKTAMAGQPPPNGAGARMFTGGNGNGQGNGSNTPDPVRIEVRGKYSELSAEDMSYIAMLDRFNRNTAHSDLRGRSLINSAERGHFLAELADKAQKSISAGKLTIDRNGMKALDMAAKANELDHSTQASFGDEWVPDLWSKDLWRKARLENVILPLFRSFDMPSNPYELPIEGSDPTVYYVPETTQESELLISGSGNTIPDSKVGSGKVQITAKKLGLRVGVSAELTEDSIIPIASIYREQAERAIMDAIDHVLLNGDDTNAATGNINLDDADPADTEKYLAFDGILHSALVEDTTRRLDAGGASPSLSFIRQLRFKMPTAYAQQPGKIAYIVGGEVYAKLLNIDEFLTVDKYGPNATILNGEIGKIDGSPVLTTAELALAEADGKKSTTANNNILGRMAAVYKPNWYVGYKRRIAISLDYLPYYDSYQLTATVRLGFAHFDNDSASVLYDLAV